MNIDEIEIKLSEFLSRTWKLEDTPPFLRSYVRLLLVYKNELSHMEVAALLDRLRQLSGEQPAPDNFHELRITLRERLNQDLSRGETESRNGALNRLFFAALLDSAETDFFYLTEPMFEFSKIMSTDPETLKRILDEEFSGFMIRQAQAE
ncbi:hypothetical protein VA603_10985 [Stenotrophomonas sp. MH1]|uniref:Uncharacterized protein n=1 Tax=Stenotrophomonas capsici TaxID=3110230 RepID=A0ABU5V3W3_9GAMM|nr:hypothetical protein [Stenotrophomonas sp. MH1]MEA5668059.1 hypothetical protein [Stenotrophomonas sp. MH1]